MSGKNLPSSTPRSPETTATPSGVKSPIPSIASSSAAYHIDQHKLAQALDKIHDSASQCDVLTTFNDIAPPPDSTALAENRGLGQHGFSGLYSRFKEAVGAVNHSRSPSQDAGEGDNQDAASKKSSTATAATPKISTTPLTRGDTGVTNSTSNSMVSDPLASTLTSSAAHTHEPQSTKASSATNFTAPPSVKSASSSRQSIPNMTKPTAAVAPVTVAAFKELPRAAPARPEEGTSRVGGRSGSIASSEGQPSVSATDGSSMHITPETKRTPALTKLSVAVRSRHEDTSNVDGQADAPASPVKSTSSKAASTNAGPADLGLLSPPARPGGRQRSRTPAVIDRISHSGTPGGSHSRSSSVSQGTAEASRISTAAHNSVHHESFGFDEKPQMMRSGSYRIPGTTFDEGAPEMVNAKLESMRKQVMSKDFWMADGTCKECFLCGAPFSAFRRKHHCRTCGCIFDSRCTKIIPGQKFGVQGTLRVCKTCLGIISQRQDEGNMSDDSADEPSLPAIWKPSKTVTLSLPPADRDNASTSERTDNVEDDSRSLTTPMMAIPATRRFGGSSNRNSAVLEIDAPQLSRPGSSRSLKSLTSGRPQSSGHKRHLSKHNFLSRFKPTPDNRAPFRMSASEEVARRKSDLPAFHDDNVIDPDLAPFMSDESSGDEQMSIVATMSGNEKMNSSGFDHDKSNFGQYLGAGRRNRARTQGEKSLSGLSFTSRGLDDGSGAALHSRHSRRRNLSTASVNVRSPRPKSGIFNNPSASNETLPQLDTPTTSAAPKLTRSSSMRGERKPRIELNPASLLHVRKLLGQLLQDENVPNGAAWEKALIPILLKCTTSVDPDVEDDDDMDIRHYVKLKKIPGNRPGDTSYVSGVIFTKNLALKSMPRRMSNPRVVIVSFPIEYQRHQQHFMSLQPVIEQEKEFLRVVVNRISNLRPQLLLAEKSVSGLALQYLSDANIAVAYNVKPSVLSAVSRCLETEIISSVDMLSLPPQQFQTGKSTGFEVKTFVNEEIRGGKKTCIFLSSSQEELGCTIALRGASMAVLTKIKRITEFMVYVVYNLKLESSLMQDSFVQLPTGDELPSSQHTDGSICSGLDNTKDKFGRKGTLSSMTGDDDVPTSQDSNAENGVPSSASTTSPTSELLAQSIEQTNKLISLHETHARASHDSLVPEDIPMPTFYSDMVAKYDTKILSASPFVKFPPPYLLMKAREQERRLVHLKRLRDQNIVEDRTDGEKPRSQKFQLIKPHMVHEIGQRAPRQIMEVLHAVHDAEYDKALYNYQTQTRQWENYIQGNLDLFEPYAHQNIVVLYSVICSATKIPCVEPGLIAIAFYDEHVENNASLDPDCTLGQYVEDICYGAESTCTANGCDRKMDEHHRTYVHGQARITVFIEQEAKTKPRRESIMMWSYCKMCKRETSEMEMSRGTWKYSFGKYLELSFWSKGTRLVRDADVDGWNCPHDHHRDHIRYFGLQDKVIRIHYDPIDLLEIIVPRARITWKVEHDLNLKNEIFTHSQERWTRFTMSVRSRLKAIKLDNILPEKAEPCKAELERLTKKVQEEQVSLVRKLQDAYMNSTYYEVIPLNVVLREMLEKVAEWDTAFAKFEADFLPTDKDIRRLTMIQLRKMFADESKESLSSEGTIETTELTEKASQASGLEGDGKLDTQPTDASIDPSQSAASTETSPTDGLPPQGATLAAAGEGAMDRVEPLDLATPKSPGLNLPVPQPESASEIPEPRTSSALVPISRPSTPVPSSVQVSTTSPVAEPPMTVTEQIEQLRRKQQPADSDNPVSSAAEEGECSQINVETSVPIPERGSSRRTGLTVSPPLIRALSQPANMVPTLPRSQSAVGKKLFSLNKDKEHPAATETGTEVRKAPTNETAKGDKKMFGLRSHRKVGQSSIPRFVGKKKDSRVSTLARHFEQLSREFEKERIKDRRKRAATMSNSRAFLPRSSTKAIVEVYEDADEAVQEPGPIEDDHSSQTQSSGVGVEASAKDSPLVAVSHADGQSLQPETEADRPGDLPATETEADDPIHNVSRAASDYEPGESDMEQSLLEGSTLEEIAESLDSTTEIPLELPKHDKMNFMKVLTNFWNERSASEWPSLDYPLNATDHIFIDSDIIVREDEPSSVIAFALSSQDYKTKLRMFHRDKSSDHQKESSDAEEEAGSDDSSDVEETVCEARLEKSLIDDTSSHLKYQFSEGSAKMLVKIFFAEQFDALRRKCGAADRIIESLSRCLKWDSKGGKTKSVFLKTQDDRLVMKSLSPVETAAFLKFAPAYFSIMAEALFHDLPSVIAKMLGFFQVIIKNPVTNTEIKLDLLVMENLFYDRAPTRIFDLKGSMRNRKIQSTGEQNEVLLDENMVEYIYESPLFAREHSKKLLRASVWNDTLFLARQNVMDYSLMIAVDEVKRELVVGIIDCIRTYTWDKKLESWIKDRGFAGGGRNRPTVTSPKEYKSRFREAMARYILQAPNCWHQFNVPLIAARPPAELNIAGEEPTVTEQIV